MTSPRRDIVDPDAVAIYHCIARCVRRAFLCGNDFYSKRSYEHRRLWIRERLAFLVSVFSIELITYAVMSNHLHSLIQTRPDLAREWSAHEVAYRWLKLFPKKKSLDPRGEPAEHEIKKIASDPKLVEKYRARLSSVSWFNRCLNENIAVRANREDECTGRFWEGRFKCQRVSELVAVLLCSAYIDLNPVRAGTAESLENSDHTGIQDRIHEHIGRIPKRCKDWARVPLLSIEKLTGEQINIRDYLALVDATGRQMRDDKRSLSSDAAPILERLKINPDLWLENAQALRRNFRRVVGPVQFFHELANRAGRVRFQGVSQAARLFGGLRAP
jgi:hypothetical protein